MRVRSWLFLVVLVGVVCFALGPGVAVAASEMPPTALLLYDSTPPYGWIGELHALQLANLLGHFPLDYTLQPVENYTAGQVEDYRVTFYLGAEFDNPLPEAFLSDVMATERTVCWMGYNLWQLAWNDLGFWDPAFTARYGFQFAGVDASGFPEVIYKGVTLTKDVSDPDIGVTLIMDPDQAEVLATAHRPDPEASWPYVVQAGHLWYVADLPFSYTSEEDRYLAFCDLLHDIVGIDHAVSRRALIRIEDVDATATASDLEGVANYLHSRHVPFQVAVIPMYKDPLGVMGAGSPEEAMLSDAPAVVAALQYMAGRGGEIFQHGLTHQYDSVANPYNGLTGDDSEFFLSSWTVEGGTVLFGPVPEDSEAWVNARIDAGLDELDFCGLTPVAWETPHYVASALDSTVFGERFDLCAGRQLYFTADNLHFTGQFFPYPIECDVYGQRISPENLGNVEPEWFYDYPPRFPEDIVRAAQKNLVIRDSWASAYFHPFLNISYLEDVVEGIEALGYTYLPAPSLIADAGPDHSLLLGEGATLLGSVTGGTAPYTCSWTPVADLDDPSLAQPTATPTYTTVYQLTVTDDEGREDHDLVTVTVVWPPPTAEFGATPVSGGAPLTVCFTDLSTLATSWSWDFGDGATSSEQHPGHTYQNYTGTTVTYTVSLTVTNESGGDTETKLDYLSVIPVPPVAHLVGIPTSGAAPLEVDFSDLSTGHPTSWSWDFGDGGTSTERHPSHTYENSGGTTLTRTVALTATNDGGSNTETRVNYITVIPAAPTAGFSASPTSGPAPLAVTFTDSSTNTPTSWSWSFGDGATSTAQHPSHTYENPGGTTLLRTVSLTVSNDGGSDTETKTDLISVVPPAPLADFSATPTGGAAPLAVDFTDTSAHSPTSWSWDFGDGGTSTDQNPSHTYENAGGTTLLRTVSLTVSNDGGSDTETKTDLISVVPPAPLADFSATPTSGAAPLAVDFTDTSAHSPTSWSWDFGDGGTSTERHPSHTYENSGGTTLLRTVSLTVANDGGSDTETKTDLISVIPPAPTAGFSASPISGLSPLAVSFTDSSTNTPTSWSWSFGDGATSTDQHPSHTYENAGGTTLLRTVSLTVSNDGGSDTETKTDYISVVPPAPTADFSATPTSGAAPLSVTFTDASTNSPTSWSWSFGDGGTSTEQHPSHVYQNSSGATQTRPVSLTVTSDGGSASLTKVDYISVGCLPPVASFTASQATGAAPLLVTFTDTSSNTPTSWSWDFGDGGTSTEQHPSHTYENDGGTELTWTVSLTVINEGGSDTETKTGFIAVDPIAPVADFSATPTEGVAPLLVTFTDLSTGHPTSWSWDFGDGATSSEQHPTHEYANARHYTVALTAANDGGSDTETKLYYLTVLFADIAADYWAYGQVMACVDAGIVGGYWDHTYRPELAVDRAQMAVFMSRALAGGDSLVPTGPESATFPDVPTTHWAFKYVEYCRSEGIVSGYWDGYHPGENVDRAQMAVYIARAVAGGDSSVPDDPDATPFFTDVPGTHWAYKYIEYCHDQGVVGGYWDGTYRPTVTVNRAQMAVFVQRAFTLPIY